MVDVTSGAVDVNLAAIDASALLVAGGIDTLAPAARIEKLARMLPGEYRLFPELGHCDLLLREPDWCAVAGAISSWLDSTDG